MGRIWKDRVTGREYRDNMAAEHMAMSVAQLGAPLLRPITTFRVKPKTTVVRYGGDTAFIDEVWHCGSHLMSISHTSLPGVYELEVKQYTGWPGLMASAAYAMNHCLHVLRHGLKWAPHSKTLREERAIARRLIKVEGHLPADDSGRWSDPSDAYHFIWFTSSWKKGLGLNTHLGRPYGTIRFSEAIRVGFRRVDTSRPVDRSVFGKSFSQVLHAISVDDRKVISVFDAQPKHYPRLYIERSSVPAVFSSQGMIPAREGRREESLRDSRDFAQLCAKHGIHHLEHPSALSLRLGRKNGKPSRRRGSEP